MKKAKLAAVKRAIKEIKDGWVIGVGSGSTVSLFLEELAKLISSENLRVSVVPGSSQSYLKAISLGIDVESLDSHPELDADFDGADEATLDGFLIKGGGAALTREKVLASCSKRFIVMVDESKIVKKLGSKRPVPIEVIPFALKPVMVKLEKMGAKPIVRLAEPYKNGPVITDNGNYIIDAYFKEITSPPQLELQLNTIEGVIENGIFSRYRVELIVGYNDGTSKIYR